MSLFSEFPPTSTADWEAAIGDTKKLIWQTDEGFSVKPFYRSEDTVPPYTGDIQRGWKIRAEIDATDAVEARRQAMEALERDAGEIAFMAIPALEGILVPTQFDSLRVPDDGRAIVSQLAFALQAGGSSEISFPIGSNYFFEIAKLRAARNLLPRARIHARTSRWNKTIYDPYVNLLRSTTEAMAAVIGGCDSLTIAPFDSALGAASDRGRRLALSTHLLLKHEAHLDRVADPSEGSWYIEWLTQALVQEARDPSPKPSPPPHVFVGTNRYPNLKEHADPAAPDTQRATWPLEQIRLANDRSGNPPRVLLVRKGDPKMSLARADFAINFFGSGGFRIVEKGPAELLVLCSSDAEYPELIADALQVGPPMVIAGAPQDLPGVAGFINLRSDPIAVLSEWQRRLGVVHD